MTSAIKTTPTTKEMFSTFGSIGILSFGGPAAQISLMHKILVDEKQWINEKQFLNALSFCMLLPGPEAMQLATYTGWRIMGIMGGLIAGLLFVLPGALIVLGLSAIYAYFGDLPIVSALFLGVKATVLIVVIEALLRISKRALKGPFYWAIAFAAFVGIFFFSLPYPLIVLLAAILGFLYISATDKTDGSHTARKTSLFTTFKTVIIGLFIWWVPVFLVDRFTGLPILSDLGLFFSKLAVVTFGGAYAVLAYMGQDVVSAFGWLSAGEMMDGLGLAETTPGPLILVTEFVGFLSAFKEGGLTVGIYGALLTLWVTFVPCFLWIFTGAPYIDFICAQPRLNGALSAITAAVVGVILNLSVWFGLHVFFATVNHEKIGVLSLWVPEFSSINISVLALALISAFLLLKLHWNILLVLFLSALFGVATTYIA